MSTATSWKALEEKITRIVKQGRRAVAVSFRDSEPADVKKFEGTEPSGCSFWRLAAEGKTFYTMPENHYNCAVGAYTHNIALSPEREKETEETLKMMFDLGYGKKKCRRFRGWRKPRRRLCIRRWEMLLESRMWCYSRCSQRGRCCCRKRRIAQESAREHRRWEGRRAWRCRHRCNTGRSQAWDASGTACIQGWGKMRCTW